MSARSLLALCFTSVLGCGHSTTHTAADPSGDTSTVSVQVQSDRCELSGRLRTRATVYADATGDRIVALLDGDPFDPATFVEATITPPETADQRTRIVIAAPIPVTGWLGADARPLAARDRIDIVPDHVWLDPTFEVHAFGARAGSIEVAQPIPTTQGIASDPPGVFRRIDCTDLALSSMAGFIGPTASAGDPFVTIGRDGEDVPLMDSPGGRVIATARGGMEMQVIERTDAWVRVTESEPVHVDVWVERELTIPVEADIGVPGGVHVRDGAD